MFENAWTCDHAEQEESARPTGPRGRSDASRARWPTAVLAAAITPLAIVAAIKGRLTGPVALTLLAAIATAAQLALIGLLARRRRQTPEVAAEHDRRAELLHEIRATVAGIVLSHRMLRAHRAELPRPDRDRLDQLHDAELHRLERLLIADPERRVSSVVLDDVLAPVVEALRLRGHDVRWPGTPCRVLGRPDEVTEIVHVLLENAARHAPGHRVDIDAVRRGAWVDLRVSDHGPGVAPEVLSSLFERGSRGRGSLGSGIGLHVARRLSLEMKGRLRLDRSAAGSGATFVLTLPAGTSTDPSMAGPRPVTTQAS